MPYINVSELPDNLISALKSVGYNKKDINIDPKEKVSVMCSGGDGYRGFSVIVNLSTGERKVDYGSWGGANPYNTHNRVDLDDNQYIIPDNIAVILGSEGGTRPVLATIYINPNNVVKGLLPEKSTLSKEEISVLYAFNSLKSGPYRQEALAGKSAIVDKLVKEEYLKQSKNGATQITTKGKNAYMCANPKGY